MKFHEYLESTFVSKNIELQTFFTPSRQATAQAVQGMVNLQRSILRKLAYPAILFRYLLICLRIVARPVDAKTLVENMQKAAENATKTKGQKLATSMVEKFDQTAAARKAASEGATQEQNAPATNG